MLVMVASPALEPGAKLDGILCFFRISLILHPIMTRPCAIAKLCISVAGVVYTDICRGTVQTITFASSHTSYGRIYAGNIMAEGPSNYLPARVKSLMHSLLVRAVMQGEDVRHREPRPTPSPICRCRKPMENPSSDVYNIGATCR